VECKVSMGHLRVLVDGYVFELQIAHPRELELMRAIGKESGDSSMVALAAEMELDQVHAVRHTALINGFQSKHPAFTPTVSAIGVDAIDCVCGGMMIVFGARRCVGLLVLPHGPAQL
jgi:hypothetical protein